MKEIWTTIRRTPYQSLASFFTLFLTLFLSLAIFVFLSFLYGMLGYIESRPQVTVYFQTQTSEADILRLKENLLTTDKVASVKYVSKSEAYGIYKQMNKDNPLLLDLVSADILPASLEIYAKKPTYLPELADYLKKQSGIDEVNIQQNVIDKLLSLTSVVRKTSIGFFGYFIITTIIVLVAITHFKIALKKDEIELLQLLGASPFYIKKPFLGEALFFGVTSSVIVCGIFAAAAFILNPFFVSYLHGITALAVDFTLFQLPVWPLNPIFGLVALAFTTAFGVLISLIATLLATQKYIK